jgi:hypothetical protein
MAKKTAFLSLLLTALAMAPELAHLLEMYHKMQLTQESYGAVQFIYRGWDFLGIFQVGAVISTGILLFLMLPKGGRTFRLTIAALICLIVPLIIFFVVIFPVNVATQNWAILPANWQQLRNEWEYAHAVNALFAITAYVLLLMGLHLRPQDDDGAL